MKPPSIKGRPRKVKTVKELEKLIDKYFLSCYKYNEENDEYININPITISGLCISLGICRETLSEWSYREEFSDTIKNAKLVIENYAENQLFSSPRTAGIIFNLKNNFRWVDKSIVESTNTNVNKTLNIEIIDKDQNQE